MAIKKSFKDLSYLVSANVILKVLGLVSVMIYTRVLMKEELAVVPAFALLGRLSIVMFSMGVLPCLVRDVPSLIKEKKHPVVYSLIRTCLILVIPGIALFSYLCYALSDQIAVYVFESTEFSRYLKLLAVGIFFHGVSQLFSYIYWSMSKFKHESQRMVVVAIVKVVTGIVFVLWIGVEGLIISLVLSALVNFVIYAYNLKDIIFQKAGLYPLKSLLKESWPFYIESYLMYIRAEGDQLIVTTFLGAEALAIYYIARRPYELVKSFTQSLDRILTTSLSELKNDLEMFNNKFNMIISLNSYILLPVIFLAMGVSPFLIVFIAGPGYEQAIIPSIFLLLTLCFQFYWNSTFGRAIFILSPSTSRFRMTFIESSMLLVLILILGSYFELIGVVLGRLIATALTGTVAYFIIRAKVTFTVRIKNILIVLFASIVMCVILLGAQQLYTNYLILTLAGILAGVVYLSIVSATISGHYYKSLNGVSPVKLTDPIRYVIQKLR